MSELLVVEKKEVDYYKIDRMSNSGLTNFKRSPRHYLYEKQNPSSTPAMLFGSAFHHWVLENDTFFDKYFILDVSKRPEPDKDFRSTKNREWKSEQLLLCGNKEIINSDDDAFNKIKKMHDALMAHAPAKELLDNVGQTEVPMFWTDEVSGVKMKGKLDGIAPSIIIDLKTTTNAQPDSFSIDAYNNSYHRQAALYVDGLASIKKENQSEFYFIAIEKEPPFGVSVMKCSDAFINHGRTVYQNLLEDVRYWYEMGKPDVCYDWRSPFGYHELQLPNWVK